jgi:hypothetical protein
MKYGDINEWWVSTYPKRSDSVLFVYANPSVAYRNLEKQDKLVRKAGNPSEIQTEYVTDTRIVCYLYTSIMGVEV